MTIKKAYQYLYYKFYKHFEKGVVWMTEWKASLAMDVLICFIIASAITYYKVFLNRRFHLSENNFDLLGMVLIVAGLNYFPFHHKDKWKAIVRNFNQIDERKNKVGGWIVFSVLAFIVANLFFSFYLMSTIDWGRYR